MEEGLWLAKKAVKNGANIIISRGGTGDLIREKLSIPVVNLETSSFDIINTIDKAVTYSNKIGIVGFNNLIAAYERANKILQKTFSAQIMTSVIEDRKEAATKIERLYRLGVRVFVGGYTVIDAVKKLGFQGVLIESGTETIAEAVKHARNLLEVQLKEKEKAQILKSIIDFAYDGILGVDKNGLITVFNPVIEKLTGVKADVAIGRPVDSVVENTKRCIKYLKLVKLSWGKSKHRRKPTRTNRVPIVVEGSIGRCCYIQEIESAAKGG